MHTVWTAGSKWQPFFGASAVAYYVKTTDAACEAAFNRGLSSFTFVRLSQGLRTSIASTTRQWARLILFSGGVLEP